MSPDTTLSPVGKCNCSPDCPGRSDSSRCVCGCLPGEGEQPVPAVQATVEATQEPTLDRAATVGEERQQSQVVDVFRNPALQTGVDVGNNIKSSKPLYCSFCEDDCL